MVARLLACCPDLPMTVCVDETDPRLDEYRALGVDLIVRPGESAGVAAKIAHAVEHCLADVYVLLSDRCVPLSVGWYEALVQAALPRRVGLCKATFAGAPKDFSAVAAVSRAAIEATGWVSPPRIDHYGLDNFWNLAPRLAGIAVHVDVRIDIPGYQERDAVRARTLARRREFEGQWKRFRQSAEFAAAVERLRVLGAN